jgi:hypothetical protein
VKLPKRISFSVTFLWFFRDTIRRNQEKYSRQAFKSNKISFTHVFAYRLYRFCPRRNCSFLLCCQHSALTSESLLNVETGKLCFELIIHQLFSPICILFIPFFHTANFNVVRLHLPPYIIANSIMCRRKFVWKPLKEIAGLTAEGA